MRRILVMLTVILWGAACQQGVTDVGNPTISATPPAASPAPSGQSSPPAIAALLGGYSLPQTVSSDAPANGSPSPTAASALPACKTDAQQSPSIAPTTDPTLLVLNSFLDYGVSTRNILATYDPNTAAIAFDIQDSSAAIQSCSGTASTGSSGITIQLQCKAAISGDPDCQVTYNKE